MPSCQRLREPREIGRGNADGTTRKVTFLVPASPTPGFLSQISDQRPSDYRSGPYRGRGGSRAYGRIFSVGAPRPYHRAGARRDRAAVPATARARRRLRLAIDLLPKSDFLWNRSAGPEVEPPTEHGTVDDLLASIEREGLRVTEKKIRRTVYASRTDLLFVEAVRPS